MRFFSALPLCVAEWREGGFFLQRCFLSIVSREAVSQGRVFAQCCEMAGAGAGSGGWVGNLSSVLCRHQSHPWRSPGDDATGVPKVFSMSPGQEGE